MFSQLCIFLRIFFQNEEEWSRGIGKAAAVMKYFFSIKIQALLNLLLR